MLHQNDTGLSVWTEITEELLRDLRTWPSSSARPIDICSVASVWKNITSNKKLGRDIIVCRFISAPFFIRNFFADGSRPTWIVGLNASTTLIKKLIRAVSLRCHFYTIEFWDRCQNHFWKKNQLPPFSVSSRSYHWANKQKYLIRLGSAVSFTAYLYIFVHLAIMVCIFSSSKKCSTEYLAEYNSKILYLHHIYVSFTAEFS